MGEDVKFHVLPAESVKTYAEFVGFLGLSDGLATSLSEDVTYRLRETLQGASQFMKHAKRRRLTTSDFNRALHWSATEPIYGHGSVEEQPFKSTTAKEKDIFFVDDKEVGMRELALGSAIPTDPGKITASAQNLTREKLPNSSDKKNGQALPNGEEKMAGPNKFPLSDASRCYYDQIIKAILGDSEQCQMVALNDLETNPKISSLLPYFVNLIATGVKTYSHDQTLLRKLMNIVAALVNNQSFTLEPHVIQLVTAVMYCLLESLAASLDPANNHWSVRDDSARLLAHITRKCNSAVNYLHQQLLMTLQEVLLDDGRPYCSHYGAVAGLTELGPEALEQFLFPHLETYWGQLQQVLDDSTQSNAQLQHEAFQVYGALLQAAGCLLRSKQNGVPVTAAAFQLNGNSYPVLRSNLSPWARPGSVHRAAPVPSTRSRSSSTSDTSNLQLLYQQLYEAFGDSLLPRIAFNNWQEGAVTKTTLLRIQPLTQKYFPLRPLRREKKSIRDLIDRAKDKRRKDQEPAHDETNDGQVLPTNVPEEQKRTHKATVAPFVVRSRSRNLSRTSLQGAVFESGHALSGEEGTIRGISRSKSHREIQEAMEIDDAVSEEITKPSPGTRSKIKTGKMRRRLKRAWPFLASVSKYDYHVGVTL